MYNGMLTGITTRIGQIEGVASSSRVTVKMPIGLSFEWIKLILTNITIAQCTNIAVRINGQTIQEYRSGTEMELCRSQEDFQYGTTAGYLHFDFRRLSSQSIPARDSTLIRTGKPNETGSGLADVSTFEISFDLPSGLSSPAVSAYAAQIDPDRLGLVRYVRGLSYTPSGTGDFEVSDLPRSMLIERIGFNMTSGVFSELKVKINGNIVAEGPLAIHNQDMNNGVRVSQTNWFFLEPDPKGDGMDWIDVRSASDYRLIMVITTAANIPVVLSQLGPVTR